MTDDLEARLDDLLSATARRLVAGGARTEALGVVRDGRRLGPFSSQPSIVASGFAWRLGVLLLGTDGTLSSVGRVTRATETGRAQGLSAQVEQRRAERVAASRGRFAAGTVVNFEFVEVGRVPALWTDDDPLAVVDGRIVVRWGIGRAESKPLAEYLDERATLLLDDDPVL